jgi:hypothetical protein
LCAVKLLFAPVAAGNDNFISDAFNAALKAPAALGGFVAGTDFVVIQKVFAAHFGG